MLTSGGEFNDTKSLYITHTQLDCVGLFTRPLFQPPPTLTCSGVQSITALRNQQ